MKVWKIKKGADKRIRSHHPWVFSNELLESPKGILKGEKIELQDMKGHFLARGYGNPHSLIAFRAMSFDSHHDDPCSSDAVSNKLVKAWKQRHLLGFKNSFRLCFSEADYLPGVIVDRYTFEVNQKNYQVFSYQLLTAGQDLIFQDAENIFKAVVDKSIDLGLSTIDWQHTLLLSKNDVQIRKLEGLEPENPLVVKSIEGIDLTSISIQIQSVMNPEDLILFSVNLVDGQKTGFFLDQTHNIKLLIQSISSRLHVYKNRPVKIIDLCCYMGQWSAQIVQYLSKLGIQTEVLLVDVSDLALTMAHKNLKSYAGCKVTYKKMDVLVGLAELAENQYDVVISDPPAFVKNKKDMETGLHGYMKLNHQAFRIAHPQGVVASCTCSGGVDLVDFKNAVRKSIVRSGKKAKLIAEGGLGWDHPQLLEFPEGQYLKMLLHVID